MPIAVLAAASALACADGPRREAGGASVALVAIDTLVTSASELLGGAYDLAVAADGDVLITDYGFKHVLVVARDGVVRRTIGREGSGPGEFTMPYVVHADADSVRVLDISTSRVQVFDRAGGLVRSYVIEAPGLGAGRAFRADGALGVAIDGFEGSLALVLDAEGQSMGRFGEPLAPAVPFYDFAALKAEIRDGRVPDAFRNRAILAPAPDQSWYVAFLAEPEVRRYEADGTLLWTRRLDEPVLQAALQAFVRKNVEERNPSRMHSLQYVVDVAVAYGDLWLLLNTEDEDDGLMLVLAARDGSTRQRVTFPGLPNTGRFAVDEERRRLYMAPRGDAAVLTFELPEW